MADDLLQDPLSSGVFVEAGDILGFDLHKLVTEGPQEELTLTANAQPAILATSFAAWKQFIKALDYNVMPVFVAGHSLGEFTALAAAGALDFRDAIRLVRIRGKLMQKAVPEGEGAMAALLGADEKSVQKLIDETSLGDPLDIANINAPVQTVISGKAEAVERALNQAKKFGVIKAVRLKVSAPFHSRMMAPVREKFSNYLEETKFMPPFCPIVHNVSAMPNIEALKMAKILARQIDSPVRWVESIQYMAEHGANVFVEIGYGNVLQGLVRKILGKTWDGLITGFSSQTDSEKIRGLLKEPEPEAGADGEADQGESEVSENGNDI
jgi:[acyl-carrier-protein] S-malonyltransferase